MRVLKFGGSSVAKPERIEGIVEILKGYYSQGEKFTVVFSALGGVTDLLIKMSSLAAKGDKSYDLLFNQFSKRHMDSAKALVSPELLPSVLAELAENHETLKSLLHGIFLVREASRRTLDYVLSFGERNSCYLIAKVLQTAGINAAYLDARKIIKTDKNFSGAKVDFDLTYKKIKAYYQEHPEVQVVTGFIGAARGGLTTTLGRGGSDYTASLLAAGLEAKQIEIWTDVDGVLTADPRKVKKAFTIPSMTYAEAMEMSHFGAKVIYPPTLQPALQKNIPISIKNTFKPDFKGTYISDKSDANGHAVKGISSIGDIALLSLQGSGLFGVPGIAARLFNALALANINVILITQGSSESSISFAIQPQFAKKAKKKIDSTFEFEMQSGVVDPVIVEEDLAVIAIIGENMRYRPGISGRLFQSLGKNGINVAAIAQGSSELNVSVVIPKEDESKALNALHQGFFLSDTKEINVFMVGTGLIGSTLIKQIQSHAAHLKENSALEIKVVGLANSRKMQFNNDGIDLEDWMPKLLDSEMPMNIASFVEEMKERNLSNSIFVDNTANEQIAEYYESILGASISISTPNKIATSSSYLRYQRLKNIADRNGVQFLYETNVGAGLPVISTLRDLMNSGDRIIKIEGVLSGSLSYIFNSFESADTPFSAIVKEAKTLGYTEPDPRIDLNGVDIRRKLVILARETGLAIEPTDVSVEHILPQACQDAESIEDFFVAIAEADTHFESLRLKAAQANKRLRMIATLEDNKATIALKTVDSLDPFYTLDGSDNMIVFTTDRYKDRPLVVRGPGAGAEVTAAGIFAEIITIGNMI